MTKTEKRAGRKIKPGISRPRAFALTRVKPMALTKNANHSADCDPVATETNELGEHVPELPQHAVPALIPPEGSKSEPSVTQPAGAGEDAALQNNVTNAVRVTGEATALDDVTIADAKSERNKVSDEREIAEAAPKDQSALAKQTTLPALDHTVLEPDIATTLAAGAVPADDSTAARAVGDNESGNSAETDPRMEEIQIILTHTAIPTLDKNELMAEWVRLAEAKVLGFGQVVVNPQGGRPEGGITRAAKELPVRGKTLGARQQLIKRAIKIDTILPEAKSAVRAAKLDNNQSALLAIADENSLEKQLAKIQQFKARPRRKRKAALEPETGGIGTTTDDVKATSIPPADFEALTSEQKEHLTVLQTSWCKNHVLHRQDFDKASLVVQQYFFWNNMVAIAGQQRAVQIDADLADQTSCAAEFPATQTEVQVPTSASADASAEVPTSLSEKPW